MTDDTRRAPAALLSDALAQLTRIFRGEMALAQAEVTMGLRHAAVGIVLLVVAIVLAITALNLLAGALVAALAHAGLGPVWAAVVAGVGFAIAAAILAWAGARALKPAALVPTRALRGMQRNVNALKEGLSS